MRIRRSSSLALATLLSITAALAMIYSSSANPKSAKNVTFAKDVAPILFKQCAECHRPGEGAPFSALS